MKRKNSSKEPTVVTEANTRPVIKGGDKGSPKLRVGHFVPFLSPLQYSVS